MEENVEREEDDLEMALPHIDEKLQRVLGHFQKDFEGGVSADNLGPKFGGYGSFLPTYKRHPSSLEKNSMPTPPVELPLEGVSQKPKTPSKDPPPARRHSAASTHDYNKLPLKDKSSTKTGTISEQRSLKLRIKFCSNTCVQEKAANLWLDDSPLTPQGDMEESSTEILKIMTSELVPGGELVSPLHESLTGLSTKEKLFTGCEFVEEKSKLLKDKKDKPRGENSAIFDNDNLVHKNGSTSEGEKAHGPLKDLTDAVDAKRHPDPQKQTLSQKVIGDGNNTLHDRVKIEAKGKNTMKGLSDISSKQDGVNKCTTEGVSVQLSKNAKFNNCRIEPNGRPPIKKVVCNEGDSDLIDEWVMCDRCKKWRLLPYETKPGHLPEKWLCRMLDWLPGMNRCDVSEEETTNARNALYFRGNKHKLTSETIGIPEKKKQSSKVTQQGGESNGVFNISAKDHMRDSFKRKSLHDATHARPNSMKNSNAQQKKNLNLIDEGDAQQLKKQCKLAADQIGIGTGISKKFKANVDCPIDKHRYVKIKSTATSFPNTAPEKFMQKKNRIDLPRESSLKETAMIECNDDQNFQTSVGSINGEELSECGKSLLSNNKRKLCSASNPDDKPMKKGRSNLMKVSCNGDRAVDRTDKVQNFCKGQKSTLRNKAESPRKSSLKRDLGSEMSKTAVSSLESNGVFLQKHMDGDAKNGTTSGVENANLCSDEAISERAKEPCYNEDNGRKSCSFRNTSIKSQPSSSSVATNDDLEKAKELREYADDIKSSGFGFESNDAYFKAALKFLHGASLLDTGKIRKSIQIRVYSDAAELFENCGREYEKREERAMAALAYKCMEVASMNLIFCRHSSTNDDRQELEDALKTIPLGSHVISAQTRQSFVRLLDFTQNVNLAMEASTKSRNALAAANETDDFTLVKRVIDFSFQNVEEFTQLVGQAMDAIKFVRFGR